MEANVITIFYTNTKTNPTAVLKLCNEWYWCYSVFLATILGIHSTNTELPNYFVLELVIPHSVVIMSDFTLNAMFQYFRFIF